MGADVSPIKEIGRGGIRKINATMGATVVIVAATKYTVAPTGIVQAVAAIKWHPVMNKDVVIVLRSILVANQMTVPLLGINAKLPLYRGKSRTCGTASDRRVKNYLAILIDP